MVLSCGRNFRENTMMFCVVLNEEVQLVCKTRHSGPKESQCILQWLAWQSTWSLTMIRQGDANNFFYFRYRLTSRRTIWWPTLVLQPHHRRQATGYCLLLHLPHVLRRIHLGTWKEARRVPTRRDSEDCRLAHQLLTKRRNRQLMRGILCLVAAAAAGKYIAWHKRHRLRSVFGGGGGRQVDKWIRR